MNNMKKPTIKERREEILRIIVKRGGIDNILNEDYNEVKARIGINVTEWQNTLSYFKYSAQGQAKVLKALTA